MAKKPHRFDTGAYTVETFDSRNRKRRTWVTFPYWRAVRLAERWERCTGWSTVIRRTLRNSEQLRSRW